MPAVIFWPLLVYIPSQQKVKLFKPACQRFSQLQRSFKRISRFNRRTGPNVKRRVISYDENWKPLLLLLLLLFRRQRKLSEITQTLLLHEFIPFHGQSVCSWSVVKTKRYVIGKPNWENSKKTFLKSLAWTNIIN